MTDYRRSAEAAEVMEQARAFLDAEGAAYSEMALVAVAAAYDEGSAEAIRQRNEAVRLLRGYVDGHGFCVAACKRHTKAREWDDGLNVGEGGYNTTITDHGAEFCSCGHESARAFLANFKEGSE